MGRKIKATEEQDAYTGWRKVMFWQTGELKKIKRRTHKRERREARREIGTWDSVDAAGRIIDFKTGSRRDDG